MSKQSEQDRSARRMIRIILNFSGLFFFVLAYLLISYPEQVESNLGLNPETGQYVAMALCIAAFGDFIIARFIFKEETR